MLRKKNPADQVRTGLPAVYPRLWRFCLVLSGSRSMADDLAQRTCLRAIEKAALFKPETHLDRWMFTMARRIWLNEMRANAVRQGGGLVSIEDIDISDPKQDQETNLLAREVFSSIGALPESQRETVILVYVEGYSYKEAAAILEVPIGTIMSRLSTARRAISGQFADERTGT